MNNDALAYFLSLCDEAERVISKDMLSEKLPPVSYRVEIKEEKAAENTIPEPPKATGASYRLAIREALLNCHSCDLWMNRPEVMHASVGSMHPLILFVVDKILPDGSFFNEVDMAYFKKWLTALKLRTMDVAITSIIKCPHGGFSIEDSCLDILKLQIEVMKPQCIVFLGEAGSLIAAENTDIAITRLESLTYHNTPCQITYSPEMVLRDKSLRHPVWEDLQKAYAISTRQ